MVDREQVLTRDSVVLAGWEDDLLCWRGVTASKVDIVSRYTPARRATRTTKVGQLGVTWFDWTCTRPPVTGKPEESMIGSDAS